MFIVRSCGISKYQKVQSVQAFKFSKLQKLKYITLEKLGTQTFQHVHSFSLSYLHKQNFIQHSHVLVSFLEYIGILSINEGSQGSDNPEIMEFRGFGPSYNKIRNSIKPELIRIVSR